MSELSHQSKCQKLMSDHFLPPMSAQPKCHQYISIISTKVASSINITKSPTIVTIQCIHIHIGKGASRVPYNMVQCPHPCHRHILQNLTNVLNIFLLGPINLFYLNPMGIDSLSQNQSAHMLHLHNSSWFKSCGSSLVHSPHITFLVCIQCVHWDSDIPSKSKSKLAE